MKVEEEFESVSEEMEGLGGPDLGECIFSSVFSFVFFRWRGAE